MARIGQRYDSYEPGAVLHDAIVGTFRARGMSMDRWCRENDIPASIARHSTYGVSRSGKGRATLERIIDGAGRAMVMEFYKVRILEHAAKLEAAA